MYGSWVRVPAGSQKRCQKWHLFLFFMYLVFLCLLCIHLFSLLFRSSTLIEFYSVWFKSPDSFFHHFIFSIMVFFYFCPSPLFQAALNLLPGKFHLTKYDQGKVVSHLFHHMGRAVCIDANQLCGKLCRYHLVKP